MIKKSPPHATKLPARERILLTAHDLFYREGIRATGIDRLIREAGVTKVTFYRHFPSKNDLILAFLHYRHQRWMDWFASALKTRGNRPEAISEALGEWFADTDYRGCAFINSVGELANDLPEIVEISRDHKREMGELILGILADRQNAKQRTNAILLAIDGAIIRAQYGEPIEAVLQSFRLILDCLLQNDQRA